MHFNARKSIQIIRGCRKHIGKVVCYQQLSLTASSKVPRSKREEARLQIEGLHARQNHVTACHAATAASIFSRNELLNAVE